MGRSIADNFKKRFGGTGPKFECQYPKGRKTLSERKYRNQRLADVYRELLKSILGRDPTDDELFGRVDISKLKKITLNKGSAMDYQI